MVVGRLPPQHSPFAPLDLNDPIGLATGIKLAALRDDPVRCRELLARSTLETVPIDDRREDSYCGFFNAVAIKRSTIPYSAPPVRVSCPMAAALSVWEREVVTPAAARRFGAKVVRIDHVGTYVCRRLYGRTAGPPSQHATANAIDVTGFTLSDGRRVSVRADWHGDPAKRAFLRDVREGGCRLFRGVLGPDHNAAHHDHFHLDMGFYRVCR